jgi:hypothetical protein
VALRLCEIAGKSIMSDFNERARANFLGSLVLQAMNLARLQFPADYRFQCSRVACNPGVDQEARTVDLQVLAFHPEGCTIGSDAVALPFARRGADRLSTQ